MGISLGGRVYGVVAVCWLGIVSESPSWHIIYTYKYIYVLYQEHKEHAGQSEEGEPGALGAQQIVIAPLCAGLNGTRTLPVVVALRYTCVHVGDVYYLKFIAGFSCRPAIIIPRPRRTMCVCLVCANLFTFSTRFAFRSRRRTQHRSRPLQSYNVRMQYM